MDKSLPPLIRSLLAPECYPEPASSVELVETHASWLLLAGDFAYKIKKPITLPFLDYGTLEKRRLCCEAELRLNRRFAPEIYLAVLAITGTTASPRFGGEGTAIEFAVKMKRFAEAGRLDRVCARGELDAGQVTALADAVAAFHAAAAPALPGTRFGAPEEVLAPASENFDELAALLPDKAQGRRIAALRVWTLAEFERLTPNFVARRAGGRVRECHGDLHLGNMVLIGGQVTLFDCIEFNEDFRWIDVASEIAFTYVDLLDHRQPGLAGCFVNAWLSRSGDYDAVPVLRFYAVYRALVRAKVAAIRAAQAQGGDAEAIAAAGEYLALAESLVATAPPRLVITHGLAGCGKSVAAQGLVLADPMGMTLRLRSDVERKRLFAIEAEAASGSALDGGIYRAEANLQTYRRLRELAEQILAAGWSVVVDAAFLRRAERADFRALADAVAIAFFILAPQATQGELRQRIVARLAKKRDASEATLEVLEKQMGWLEPLDGDEEQRLLPWHPRP